jgi:hypothetical protein
MPQTSQDFALGTRLAASCGVAKRAFSFSPQWSATNATKTRTRNRIPTPRRLGARCTVSGACMFSTDYLVICGGASARSMGAAGATLESLIDSSKHIITQLLCLAQRSLMQKFQPQLRISTPAWANWATVKRRFSLRYRSAYSVEEPDLGRFYGNCQSSA